MNNYPLVSILIPTHNRPAYFDLALNSALAQDYPNIEIIISDNSDDNTTELLIKKYLSDKRIHYKYNKNYSALDNWLYVINNAHGKYFNLLCDDDIILDNKISRMMDIYMNNPGVSIVTSYRKLIDKNNNILPDTIINKPVVDKSTIISGHDASYALLKNMINFIGEFSTTLLPLDKNLVNNIFNVNSPNSDIRLYLELCKKGNLAYIIEPLSFFRQDNNIQFELSQRFWGTIDWYNIINEYSSTIFTNDDYTAIAPCLAADAANFAWQLLRDTSVNSDQKNKIEEAVLKIIHNS